MKIIDNTPDMPVKDLEIGDVVRLFQGDALIVSTNDDDYKIGILRLFDSKIVNKLKSLDVLKNKGCSVMGDLEFIYEDAELLLGGRKGEC